MKNKPITKKELIHRGLTMKASLYVAGLSSADLFLPKRQTSPMGNPIQDTSEPLKGLL